MGQIHRVLAINFIHVSSTSSSSVGTTFWVWWRCQRYRAPFKVSAN